MTWTDEDIRERLVAINRMRDTARAMFTQAHFLAQHIVIGEGNFLAWLNTEDGLTFVALDSESLLLADEVDELWKEFVSELGDARVAEYISSARNQGIIKEETS